MITCQDRQLQWSRTVKADSKNRNSFPHVGTLNIWMTSMILEILNDDGLIKRQLIMLNYIMPKNLIATTLFSRLIGHQWEQQPNYKMVSDVSLFYNLSTTKLSRKKKKDWGIWTHQDKGIGETTVVCNAQQNSTGIESQNILPKWHSEFNIHKGWAATMCIRSLTILP
jgi:hypothetical protein